ncbi:MAG TPA: DUF4398 domain-containing protein [Polyangiales bacterium]|nr:DUF4398 domain-containing protein [Polyangiales bacterium]
MTHRSIGGLAVLIIPSLGCLSGCGAVTYAVDAGSAEKIVAQARAENADYYAPYELYFAEAQLAKAREEASEGHYEDALEMVSTAEAYGRRALERSARPGEHTP